MRVMQYGTPYVHVHVYALLWALWPCVRTYVLTTSVHVCCLGSRTPSSMSILGLIHGSEGSRSGSRSGSEVMRSWDLRSWVLDLTPSGWVQDPWIPWLMA